MSKFNSIRDGATEHPEEMHHFLQNRLVRNGGVFEPDNGGLAVTPLAGLDVQIAEGYCFLRADDVVSYPVRLSDGAAPVTIAANASGNPRVDTVVIYADLNVIPNVDATNTIKTIAVEGTPAGAPTAPTNADITVIVGAGNPFIRLADVTVASAAGTINAGDITDTRSEVQLTNNDYAILTHTGAAQFVLSNVTDKVTLDTVVLDGNGLANGNDGFTIKNSGLYNIHMMDRAQSSPNYFRLFRLLVRVNATGIYFGSHKLYGSNAAALGNAVTFETSNLSQSLYLEAGDVVEMFLQGVLTDNTASFSIGIAISEKAFSINKVN